MESHGGQPSDRRWYLMMITIIFKNTAFLSFNLISHVRLIYVLVKFIALKGKSLT